MSGLAIAVLVVLGLIVLVGAVVALSVIASMWSH